jgi:hypothetical protein
MIPPIDDKTTTDNIKKYQGEFYHLWEITTVGYLVLNKEIYISG